MLVARVARSEDRSFLSGSTLSCSKSSEVLNNPTRRENARRFQDLISKTNGLSLAADIVERSFGIAEEQINGF